MQCLIGSTETRRIRYGTVERTYHHRQAAVILGIEEDKVAGKHHKDVKQYRYSREDIKFKTAFTEALEEARSHL